MMNSFESINTVATSSPTEATFKNMKCLVFRNDIGIRPDLFVEKYLTYLLGNFKFALADCRNKQALILKAEEKSTEVSQTEQSPIDEREEERAYSLRPKSQTVEVSQEIWRNKIVVVLETNKLRRSNRSVNSILEKAKPFSSNLPILPNGGTTKGNMKVPTIISHNTCAFDSLYQVYAAFFKDIKEIQNDINQSESPFDKFIRDSFFA